jgi:hypothetical protein
MTMMERDASAGSDSHQELANPSDPLYSNNGYLNDEDVDPHISSTIKPMNPKNHTQKAKPMNSKKYSQKARDSMLQFRPRILIQAKVLHVAPTLILAISSLIASNATAISSAADIRASNITVDSTVEDALLTNQAMLRLSSLQHGSSVPIFDDLPVLIGEHSVVSLGDPEHGANMARWLVAEDHPLRSDLDTLELGPPGNKNVDNKWKFRLHSYLQYFDGKYWCMWSHGPKIEDVPTQHIRYATSPDGVNWSEPKDVVPPSERYTNIARGLWLRDGEMWALICRYIYEGEKVLGMEFIGLQWNTELEQWLEPTLIMRNTLTNFPPQKLANGEWMVSKRDSRRDVSFLVGGVTAIDEWRSHPFGKYESDGRKLEEPIWYTLESGELVALIRDNGDSHRIIRSFSKDAGRSWSEPTHTNFPDASSKMFCLKLSTGMWVLASNPNPEGRDPLCLSFSRDGLVFTEMAVVEIPGIGSFQYPHMIENDGTLFLSFSRDKASIEVVKIPLSAIDDLMSGAGSQ